MKTKLKDVKSAVELIKDGASLMVGGFLGTGTPEILIDALVEKGVKDLTIICNDSAYPNRGVGKLIVNKQVKKIITSYIGLNPESGKQLNEGTLEVELVPQGTLAERIRSGGSGLGGVLTPTGVGTVVAEGKQVISIDGKDFLLEKPLRADFALIRPSVCDKSGNCVYHKATKNFNPTMATAADIVIAGCEKLVETGEIDPDSVMTPSLFVDIITEGEKPWQI